MSIQSEERTITSGESESLEMMQEKWAKLYAVDSNIDFNKRWHFEDFDNDKGKFFDEIEKLKIIQPERYMIMYLLTNLQLGIGVKNVRGFIEYLKQNEYPEPIEVDDKQLSNLLARKSEDDIKDFKEEDYVIIWSKMLERLRSRFRENGYDEKSNFRELVHDLERNFDFDTLKTFAFGLHMSVKHFQIFLQKVLKRKRVDFYERKEVLTYLTLEYAESCGENRYFEAYKKLEKIYEKIEIPMEVEGIEGDLRTELFKQDIDKMVKDNKSLFDSPIEEFSKYLGKIELIKEKIKNSELERTEIRIMKRLWKELKEEMMQSQAIELFVKDQYKKSAEVKEEEKKTVEIKINFKDKSQNLAVKKGTEFVAVKKIGDKYDKKDMQARFVVLEDWDFGKNQIVEDKIKVTIPIEPLCTAEEYAKREADGLWKDVYERCKPPKHIPEFVQERHNPSFEIEDKRLVSNVKEIKLREKIRYAKTDTDEKEKEKNLTIICLEDTVIPKDTIIKMHIDNKVFRYAVSRKASIKKGKEEIIRVVPLTENNTYSKWYVNEELPSLYIKKVRNPQYVSKDHSIRVERDEKVIPLEDISFSKTPYAIANKKKDSKSTKGENGEIILKCYPGSEFREGTVFKVIIKDKAFEYRVKETIEAKRIETDNIIEALWLNEEDFKKYLNDREQTCFEKNKKLELASETTGNIENATLKKGVVVKGENVENERNSYKGNDTAILRFIYGIPEDRDANAKVYKGFPNRGSEYFLNQDVFKKTQVTDRNMRGGKKTPEEIRNLILALLFMRFTWKEINNGFDTKKIVAKFERRADKLLNEVGLQPFYKRGYAYDALLALLLNCQESFFLHVCLWSQEVIKYDQIEQDANKWRQ